MSEATPFREDLLKARSLFREGHLDQAIALLDCHLNESDPISSFALRERGRMKSFHGDHLGAIADFTAVILRWPTNSDGFTGRADARKRAGDLQGAIEDWSAAISINPQHQFAFLQRGRVKAASGDWSGAVSDFSAAMEHDQLGPLSGLLNRGVARHRLGDLSGAIDDLTEAMRLECGQPIFAPLFRGRVKLSAADYEGAIADFTAAIEAFPQLTNAFRQRAQAKALAGDQKGAEDDLRSYHQLGGRDLPAYE